MPNNSRDKMDDRHDKSTMNIVLSTDYEVFFGKNTGTVDNTLLEPSQALCNIAARHGVPLVFFVDIGFLLRLCEEALRFPYLMRDYDRVMRQLEQFVAAGHELQLHVHPHWEDSSWRGEAWHIDTRRFRLHDFSGHEISGIVQRYTQALRAVAGDDGVFAYRAGGWMIQPFETIKEALHDAGIYIDSTVFSGGTSEGKIKHFDFSGAPSASRWFFDNNPLLNNSDGEFLEIPIANYQVSPTFYWRYAVIKKFGGVKHQAFGKGKPIRMGCSELVRKLSHWTNSEVSMDGYKASFLAAAFRQYELAGKTDFVVIGHPKALTRYSLEQLERFIEGCKANPSNQFVGFSDYRSCLADR